MEPINPYASPQAVPIPPLARTLADVPLTQAWHSGDLLVVGHNARLPNRCVKCNIPVEDKRKFLTLSWHSPLAFVALLLGLLPYIVLAVILTKKMPLSVCICPQHRRRRRNAMLLAWLGSLLGIVIVCAAFAPRQASAVLMILGMLLLITSLIGGIIGSRIVWAKKIDKTFAWIKGCCPEYLAELPDFPGKA